MSNNQRKDLYFGRDSELFVTHFSTELMCYVVDFYRNVYLERCGNLYRIQGAIGKFYELSDVLNDIDKKLEGDNVMKRNEVITEEQVVNEAKSKYKRRLPKKTKVNVESEVKTQPVVFYCSLSYKDMACNGGHIVDVLKTERISALSEDDARRLFAEHIVYGDSTLPFLVVIFPDLIDRISALVSVRDIKDESKAICEKYIAFRDKLLKIVADGSDVNYCELRGEYSSLPRYDSAIFPEVKKLDRSVSILLNSIRDL